MRVATFALLFACTFAFAADAPVITFAELKPGEPPTVSKIKPLTAYTLTTKSGKPARWELADANPAVDLLPSADGVTARLKVSGPVIVQVLAASNDAPIGRMYFDSRDDSKPPAPLPPDTSLQGKLQRAYSGEKDAATLADLTELYRQAIPLADDKKIKTVGELAERLSLSANTLAADKLKATRAVLLAALMDAFPDDADLTDGLRKNAGKLFTDIYTALKGVK